MWGCLGAAGHMQTPNLRGRLSWGRGGLVFQVQAMPFDRQEFFRKQIEESRELERQAVNGPMGGGRCGFTEYSAG